MAGVAGVSVLTVSVVVISVLIAGLISYLYRRDYIAARIAIIAQTSTMSTSTAGE